MKTFLDNTAGQLDGAHYKQVFGFFPYLILRRILTYDIDDSVYFIESLIKVCLMNRTNNRSNCLCVSGSRLRPKTLQAVDVPVIDNRVCERWHRSNGINVVIYDEMMCAGYSSGGKDSCQVRIFINCAFNFKDSIKRSYFSVNSLKLVGDVWGLLSSIEFSISN